MKKYVFSIFLVIANNCMADESGELFDTILQLDTKFFNSFNRCDIDTMGKMFAVDLEFYHDTGGVSGYESTMEITKSNCDQNVGLRRELVKGSLIVYPVADFGAIQIGKHTFCHEENGKDDCGTFEFVHIWKNTDGNWQITRVVSFGH